MISENEKVLLRIKVVSLRIIASLLFREQIVFYDVIARKLMLAIIASLKAF